MTPTNALQVDASNAEQLQAWDGDEGAYWAAHADYFDRSASPYHEKLMTVAAIAADRSRARHRVSRGPNDTRRGPGGDRALGARGGSVVQMIDEARRRAVAEGVLNAFFEQADAQIYPFEAGAFDEAISRSAAMFFGDQVAAFASIARALRPRGRLGLTTWQSLPDNEWVREIMGALAGGRELPSPPPNARADSRCPPPTGSETSSGAPGSPTSSSRKREPACGSATTQTTLSSSCSG